MKYFAFLRAINVGGHTVKMDALQRVFESLGFTQVSTFIASGNVQFDTPITEPKLLEEKVEKGLKAALGFEVATFIRTEEELRGITQLEPFTHSDLKTAVSVQVAFLKAPLQIEDQKKILSLGTSTDQFFVHSREIYWLVRTRQHESSFSNTVLEKTLKSVSTIRGIETLKKMLLKAGKPSHA